MKYVRYNSYDAGARTRVYIIMKLTRTIETMSELVSNGRTYHGVINRAEKYNSELEFSILEFQSNVPTHYFALYALTVVYRM